MSSVLTSLTLTHKSLKLEILLLQLHEFLGLWPSTIGQADNFCLVLWGRAELCDPGWLGICWVVDQASLEVRPASASLGVQELSNSVPVDNWFCIYYNLEESIHTLIQHNFMACSFPALAQTSANTGGFFKRPGENTRLLKCSFSDRLIHPFKLVLRNYCVILFVWSLRQSECIALGGSIL